MHTMEITLNTNLNRTIFHSQARVQEFVRGGGQNLKAFFLPPPLDTRLIVSNLKCFEIYYYTM